jgi:hypothetical protein
MKTNHVDEDEMHCRMYKKGIWFHMHEQTLGSCLKWGSVTHPDSNSFLLNINSLKHVCKWKMNFFIHYHLE